MTSIPRKARSMSPLYSSCNKQVSSYKSAISKIALFPVRGGGRKVHDKRVLETWRVKDREPLAIGKSYGENGENVFIFCNLTVNHRRGEGGFTAIIGERGERGCRRQFRQIIYSFAGNHSIPKTNVGKRTPVDRSQQTPHSRRWQYCLWKAICAAKSTLMRVGAK
jgi:hypothetical protein